MVDQAAGKKIHSGLTKREDLNNKVCNDCLNPNPQWASLSFAIFICLQCAGAHRGFGVHVSFVRSISMDTWQDEQIRRMQLGGNSIFREFMRSYEPVDQGGYKEGLSTYDTYHCWAASQYREKLDAMVAGRDWSPSAPPPTTAQSSRAASPSPSVKGLRKSRAFARTHSPNSLASPALLSPRQETLISPDQRAANEAYFAALGQANDNRPTDVPPSQGGRYQGFGSTPSPKPAMSLSSAAVPSLSDLQENPMAAIGKGWSLFSAAVVGATKVVSETVIQPGMEKVTDPTFQASIKGYMTEAQKRAAMVRNSANQWSKQQFGVDVVESIGGVVDTVKEKVGGGPTRTGYGAVPSSSAGSYGDETSALYHDDDTFFEYGRAPLQSSTAAAEAKSDFSATGKKDDWEDEWKDF